MKPLTSYKGAQWLLRMHPDKQDTLLKLAILTMAAILCKYRSHPSETRAFLCQKLTWKVGACVKRVFLRDHSVDTITVFWPPRWVRKI